MAEKMDEPEHALYRKLLPQAFPRRSLERWEHEAGEIFIRGATFRSPMQRPVLFEME